VRTLAILSCAVLMSVNNQILAAENDISYSIGLKTWAPDVDWNGSAGTGISSKDPSIAVGFGASLRMSRYSLGYNYTPGSFEFGRVTIITPYNTSPLNLDISMDRVEKDLYFGFDVNNNFTLIVGKKTYDTNIYQNNVILVNSGVPGNDLTTHYNFNGYFYGLAGRTNLINDNWILFFTYSMSKTEDNDLSLKGPAYEFGSAFVIPEYNLLFSLSLRQQSYDIYQPDGSVVDGWDFSGLTLSANLNL